MKYFEVQSAMRAVDEHGNPVPLSKRYIYRAGTSQLAPIYSDSALIYTTANPMKADEIGNFDLCYLLSGSYRIVIEDPQGHILLDIDGITVSSKSVSGVARGFLSVTELLSDQILGYSAAVGRYKIGSGDLMTVSGGNYTYIVAASHATDHHLTTEGGVKLYVQPGPDGSYNVLAFGAKGDGATDDQPVIQAAVDAIPDRGAVLWFPPGIYVVGSSIIPPSIGMESGKHVIKPILFKGGNGGRPDGVTGSLSESPTLILATHAGTVFDLCLGTDADTFFDSGFEDLMISGTKIGDAIQMGSKGIYGNDLSRNATLRNISLRDFDINIHFTGAIYTAAIRSVNSVRSITANLKIDGRVNSVGMDDCHFDVSETDCVVLGQVGSGVGFRSSSFENAGKGLSSGVGLKILSGFGGIDLDGCYFESNWQDIHIDNQGSTSPSGTLNIRGGWIYPYAKQSSAAAITTKGRVNLYGVTINDGQNIRKGLIDRVGSSKPRITSVGCKTDEHTQIQPLLWDSVGDYSGINGIGCELIRHSMGALVTGLPTTAITAATQANPCQITSAGHGAETGDIVYISGIAGMTEVNGKPYFVTKLDADNFTLDGVDSSGFTAYASGGAVLLYPDSDTYFGTAATMSNHNSGIHSPPLTLHQRRNSAPVLKLMGRSDPGNKGRTLVNASDVTTATPVAWAKVELEDQNGNLADGDYYVPVSTLA